MKRKAAAFHTAALHRIISQSALGRSSALPLFDCFFSLDIFILKNAFTQFIFQNRSFQNCISLKRLDLAEPMTEIPSYCFYYANIPNNFDFSKITVIKNNGIAYTKLPQRISLPECTVIEERAINICNVEEIFAPKCTSIGNYALQNNYRLRVFSAPVCENAADNAFNYCYALETAEFADDCVFGKNCFNYCYCLYPRPDGSTN